MTPAHLNLYLHEVLLSQQLTEAAPGVMQTNMMRERIQQHLTENLIPQLAGTIVISGSTARHTAIRTKYDVDIIVPFRWDAGGLEVMLNLLTKELKYFAEGEWRTDYLRRQRVSYGLQFSFLSNRACSIDVVPGIEKQEGHYAMTGALKLWNADTRDWILTNPRKQLKHLDTAGGFAKQVVRLLKLLRHTAGHTGPKSFLLELMTVEALRHYLPHDKNNLLTQLQHTLSYLSQHLRSMPLTDPGNPGNDLRPLLRRREVRRLRRLYAEVGEMLAEGSDEVKGLFPVAETE